MAARVQAVAPVNTSGAATASATWPGATTPGNLLVVAAILSTNGTQYTAATCADGGRETWTQVLVKVGASTKTLAIFYAKNCVGGAANAVTVTFTGGTLSTDAEGISLMEYSGCDTVAPLDTSNSNTGATATAGDSGAITIAQAAELVVAVLGFFNGPGATFTADTTDGFAIWAAASSDTATLEVEDNLSRAAGAVTPAFTWTPTHSWVMASVAFKPAAAATVQPGFFGSRRLPGPHYG